jgi:hypothetical protein
MPSPASRLASSKFAAIAVAANLVCCALLGGTWLLVQHSGGSEPAPNLVVAAPPATDTTTTLPSAPETTSPTTPTTTTGSSTETETSSSALTAETQQISAPGGLETTIPTGWTTQALPQQSSVQATDPQDPRRTAKFGGAPPTDGSDIISYHTTYERQVAHDKGYVLDHLEPTTVRGYEAVDWEFEWSAPEGRRHVHVTYWRTGGIEFYVYLHGPASEWASLAPIFQEMLDNSTP